MIHKTIFYSSSYKLRYNLLYIFLLMLTMSVNSCLPVNQDPVPGPDKQSAGTWYGAAIGAGSGAVIGAQLIAATGPGAFVGAGFGAVFGMFHGLGVDMLEEDQLRRLDEEQKTRELAWAQHVLAEQYQRRLELHPHRDIFPADLFFEGDSVMLRPGADVLVRELGKMTHQRMPWSRIMVASYATARDQGSEYAKFITQRRAQQIAIHFAKAGVEPRRILVRGQTIPEPILLDPNDSPDRYRQVVEIMPIDY